MAAFWMPSPASARRELLLECSLVKIHVDHSLSCDLCGESTPQHWGGGAAARCFPSQLSPLLPERAAALALSLAIGYCLLT
jgi:hypothetical protein